MASSLVSVLKAIPDPISQGSAGAVFIVSKISGMTNAVCCFFADLAATKRRKRKTDDACFIQDTPVSMLLSTDRSACMQSGLGIYGLVSKVKTGL
jgi:hypothetical protein